MKKPRTLTKREWYCVLLAAHFAVGRMRAAPAILKKALTINRLPERMFGELFLHLSLLLGFPTMLEGLSILRTVAKQSRSSTGRSQSVEQVMAAGRKVLKRIYGDTVDRLLVNMKSMHVSVPDVIVRDVYGRIIARPGLSLREREVINVAVLSIQRLDHQLYSHIRGAMRLGVTRGTLRTTIVLSSRIARISPADSLNLLTSFAGTNTSV